MPGGETNPFLRVAIATAVLAALLPAHATAQGDCLDYADHLHWTDVGLALPDTAQGIAYSGAFQYIAADASGLIVVDTHDPVAPKIVAQLPLPGRALEIALIRDLAIVAAGEAGVHIVSIAPPEEPSLLGTVDTYGVAMDVALTDHHAFVADGIAGMTVVEFTDPAAPKLVGATGLAWGIAQGIDLVAGRAYVAFGFHGLVSVDITDPTQPLILDIAEVLGIGVTECVDVAVTGDHLVAALTDYYGDTPMDWWPHASVALLVRETLELPLPEGYVRLGDEPVGRIALYSDHLAHVTGTQIGHAIIDISDPAAPALVGRVGVIGAATAVGLGGYPGGALAWVGTAEDGLQAVDVTEWESPPVAAAVRINAEEPWGGAARALARGGDHVFVVFVMNEFESYWSGHLEVFDVSEPGDPVSLGSSLNLLPGDFGAFTVHDLEYAQGFLYGSFNEPEDFHRGLRIIDVTDPAAPVDLGPMDDVVSRDVLVYGDLAYAIERDQYLKILDISDPADPAVIAEVDVDGGQRVMLCPGGICVMEYDDTGGYLKFLDVTNPTDPQPLSQVYLPGVNPTDGAIAIPVNESHFYVTDGNGQVLLFDLSNPTVPVLLGATPLPGEPRRMAQPFGWRFIVAGTAGVELIDLDESDQPVPLGSLPFDFAWDILRHGPHVYIVADNQLVVAHPECRDAELVVAAPEEPPSASRIVGVYPNPFNPRVEIAFALEQDGEAVLAIHDLRGRLVRTLRQGRLEAGRHSVLWYGTDERGAALASGIYLVSLRSAGERFTRKVVLAR